MQSSSSNRPFKPNLAGASPATDAMLSRCNQFLHAALRRRRFVVQIHVRATVSKPLCLSQRQGEFRKLVFVGASPTRGSTFHQGRDVTVSISACDADCAGANPVALTISVFDGPLVVDYRTQNEIERGCSSTAIERPDASSGDAGSRPAFRFLSHSTFCPSSFSDGPLSLG